MGGLDIPKNRQVVMLDNHQRYSTASVIGSYRDMRVAADKLLGRAHYSTVAEAEGAFIKMREGHLTDYSAGYQVLKSTWIPAGETRTLQGKEYPGPVSIVTKWKIRELSNCPIGADELSKTRNSDGQNNFTLTPNKKQSNRQSNAKETKTMNAKLRKLLVTRGLTVEATDAEAWRYFHDLDESARAEITNEATADPAPDPAATPSAGESRGERGEIINPTLEILADPVAEERVRAAEIRNMGRRYDCLDELTPFIDDGSTVDQARAKALEIVDQKRTAQPEPTPGFTSAVLVADGRDKFRAAAQDALMVRAGIADDTDQLTPGHDELTGYGLVEVARMALAQANQPSHGNPLEMVGRALTTSDFPILLANVANKSLAQGFEAAEETWQKCFATGSVNDFKIHTQVRVSETDDLEEVKENGEYKRGGQTEAKEEYQIATYGKLFAISRQAIINDDLGALTTIPQGHGEAASRKVGDVAWAVFVANAVMGDGVALFHATHGNLGAAGLPSVKTLGEAIKLMKSQKDIKGLRRLNLRPNYFIAPVNLEGYSEQYFTTIIDQAADITGVNNPYAGKYFERIYEPRLDDASAITWYLAARKGKTVRVNFLYGKNTPYMEVKKGWDVDGFESKIRIDVGAMAEDWRGLIKNAGASLPA